MMWDWQGYGIVWWGLVCLAMLAVWALVVWLVVEYARGDRAGGIDPEATLAERFARGEIDADEYRERLHTLQHTSPRRVA